MNVDEELACYLRGEGFERFIDAWVDKYQSLGYFGGKISLYGLDKNEQSCLSGLLGCDLSKGKLQLNYDQFKQKMSKTRFDGADFLKVIEMVKGEMILTKKEVVNLQVEKFIQFQNNLLKQFNATKAYDWLNNYLITDSYTKRYFKNNENKFMNILINVANALNDLPIYTQDCELLAMFSQRITKDPHYFDEDLSRDLLLKGIAYMLNMPIKSKSSEEISEILLQAGILKDDLSNYCYICHIKPKENNKSWIGFYEMYEPWNLNLYNLNQIKTKFLNSPIFIVENPAVFRSLCLFIREEKLDIGLISSNGQINLCTYYLLDRLVLSGCQLYYAGDFDPEGLIIADKLKQKYLDSLTLCEYKEKLFDKIKIYQVDILEKRLLMLDTLKDEELKLIGNKIKEASSFGYQEGLIEEYKNYILEIIISRGIIRDG